MSNIIDLTEYGPIISDKETGEEIYNKINEVLKSQHTIIINLDSILSMATFCAKQIFGKLYLELSPTVFFERIKIQNANDDIKLIINMGIHSALNDE